MAWAQNLLGLCLFGCAPDAAFLGFAWWLKFRFAWWLKFRSGWGTIPLFLGVPKATFRDFWGCSSAMAWTENLLGLCLFGRAPDAAFLGFAWWLKFRSGVSKSNVSAFFWLRFRVARALFLCFFFATFRHFSGCGFASLGHYFFVFSLFLVGSKSDVSAFFRLRFRNGSGTKPAGVLLFRMRVPNTFFLSLAWWLAGFFFVFSRFQKQRFGSFLAAVSHGLGTISFFLMGSKSDVSAFFRLRFRNGLGTKPAGALPFRMRSRRSFLRLCLVAEVSLTFLPGGWSFAVAGARFHCF